MYLHVLTPKEVGRSRNLGHWNSETLRHTNLLVGTNIDLVSRLLTYLISKHDTSTKSMHLMLQQVYWCLIQEQKAPVERAGKLWWLERDDKILQPGMWRVLKLQSGSAGISQGPTAVLEAESSIDFRKIHSDKGLSRSH